MAAGLVVVACGTDTPHVPEAAATPLTAATVALKQTGDALVSIDQSSVHYRLDDARLIQITLSLHSQAPTAQSVSVLASLYDESGRLIGDASGGATDVPPNASTQVRLSGPDPNGTISSATFEVHLTQSSTPAH
jgi:hypothetical protein